MKGCKGYLNMSCIDCVLSDPSNGDLPVDSAHKECLDYYGDVLICTKFEKVVPAYGICKTNMRCGGPFYGAGGLTDDYMYNLWMSGGRTGKQEESKPEPVLIIINKPDVWDI